MMIEVKEDQTYVIGSQDNNFIYNHIYSDDSKYQTHKVCILIKNEDGTVVDSSILSFEGFSQIGESSYIVVKNEIFILAGKYLMCLDLNGKTLQ